MSIGTIANSLMNVSNFDILFQSKYWKVDEFLSVIVQINNSSSLEGFEHIVSLSSNNELDELRQFIGKVITTVSFKVNKHHSNLIYNEIEHVYGQKPISISKDVVAFKKMIFSLSTSKKVADEHAKEVFKMYAAENCDDARLEKLFRIYKETYEKKIAQNKIEQRNKNKEKNEQSKDISNMTIIDILKRGMNSITSETSAIDTKQVSKKQTKKNKQKQDKKQLKKEDTTLLSNIASLIVTSDASSKAESEKNSDKSLERKAKAVSKADSEANSEREVKEDSSNESSNIILEKLFENPHLIESLDMFEEFSKIQIEITNDYIRDFLSFIRNDMRIKTEDLYYLIIYLNNHLNETLEYEQISNNNILLYYEITKLL